MTIEFIPATCPSCGGELRVPNNRDNVNCMYCGQQVIIHNPNNVSQRANIDNWMKLANAAGDSNAQEAIHYYNKILEFEPENYLAWFGKGHCVWYLSTLQNPRVVEMITCFQKSLEFSPNEGKKEKIDIICCEMLKFSIEYYTLATDTFKRYYKDDQAIKDLTEQFDLSISIFDAVIGLFPTFSGYTRTLDSVIQICEDISKFNITPQVYKMKMHRKVADYKEKIQISSKNRFA